MQYQYQQPQQVQQQVQQQIQQPQPQVQQQPQQQHQLAYQQQVQQMGMQNVQMAPPPQYAQQMPQQYYMQSLTAQIPPPPPPPNVDSSKLFEKCTCKQEGNRIPRPRNAFILFRQKHHQALLEEGNVIRTNPDVSRELGRRWRNLPPEEKEYWNKQAAEEKKRHAEKYPGYKYTPRRNNKKNCPHCSAKQAIKNHNLAVQSYVAQYPNHSYLYGLPSSGAQYYPQGATAGMPASSQMAGGVTSALMQQTTQAIQQSQQVPQQQQQQNSININSHSTVQN
ncbi:unnamed protein product [Ambrosiozyma monospora]|uniref:Unnamed protein product n=1 Tax=Ambrosiozyma monospora TaxID=43982 RepID=A0ACB5TGG4_AMBMO|nr:unnamed protein product [Ambrosiozyma monospora]